YAREHLGKAPLAPECNHQMSGFEQRYDARRDAAADVDAAGRDHLEREIARLRAKDRSKSFDRRSAKRIAQFGAERALDDARRAIVHGKLRGCVGGLRRASAVAEKVVKIRYAEARAHHLAAHVLETRLQIAQQIDV